MKTPIWLLLRFVAVTVPLTGLWLAYDEAVWRLFIALARPLLIAIGAVQFPPSAVREATVLYVPFLGLLAATPDLSWRRRLYGLALGLLGIFLSHVALGWWASICFADGARGQEAYGRFLPGLTLVQGMPLFAWLVVALPVLSDRLARVLERRRPSDDRNADDD